MDFLKKFSETVMDTAATIGAKSNDLLETGRLKLQRSQLESALREKKTEIGNLVYFAHQQNTPADEIALGEIFAAIQDLENQIAAVDEKLQKEEAQQTPAGSAKMFCSKCGQELAPGAKFCNSCGQAQ